MSDSESETGRVPRRNPLVSGEGASDSPNLDRSADHSCLRCSDGLESRYVPTSKTFGHVLLWYSPREPRACSCIKSDY